LIGIFVIETFSPFYVLRQERAALRNLAKFFYQKKLLSHHLAQYACLFGSRRLVWRIGENNLGGNSVWVIGAGGRVYYYAHLEKYAPELKVGDAVTIGIIPGFVGTSERKSNAAAPSFRGLYIQRLKTPLPLFR
jgi:hypothetical protein